MIGSSKNCSEGEILDSNEYFIWTQTLNTPASIPLDYAYVDGVRGITVDDIILGRTGFLVT